MATVSGTAHQKGAFVFAGQENLRRSVMAKFHYRGCRGRRGARRIAEAILFQALQDIWCAKTAKESMEFFGGEGFVDCADVIGMSLDERHEVMLLVKEAFSRSGSPSRVRIPVAYNSIPASLH
jgi:hypothetical protein